MAIGDAPPTIQTRYSRDAPKILLRAGASGSAPRPVGAARRIFEVLGQQHKLRATTGSFGDRGQSRQDFLDVTAGNGLHRGNAKSRHSLFGRSGRRRGGRRNASSRSTMGSTSYR
jgi:hypothetical protein